METIKEYAIFLQQGDLIHHNGTRLGALDMLREDFPDAAIIPADEVPENWADMTIENGGLVPASVEVLETRRQTETEHRTEVVRASREMRYRSQTDALLFDAMELYAQAHPQVPGFAAWLEAKEQIREELPKP